MLDDNNECKHGSNILIIIIMLEYLHSVYDN